jgi:hypothetical protein
MIFLIIKVGINRKDKMMSDFLWIVLVILIWFSLSRWILPRFGVPT